MTNEDLMVELDRLIALLVGGVGGWADTVASKDFEFTLFRLDGAFADPYENRKISSARTWIPILFSSRKHAQWGVDEVRQFILADLTAARRSLR